MRDQETTLDWFNVRYYAGWQGRFQSPDPANAGADPSNPQSSNGSSYVANNPLSYTDPSGMFVEAAGIGSAGGPIGTAIGVAIDLGEILAGIFGGGLFGGPPPSIAPSLATPSSPIMGPTFSHRIGVQPTRRAVLERCGWGSSCNHSRPYLLCRDDFESGVETVRTPIAMPHYGPCSRSLGIKFKFGPEVEAGPVKLGFSLYKNLTTGGSGGIMEANAGLLGVQGDYQTPTGGPSTVGRSCFTTSLVGADPSEHSIFVGHAVQPNPSTVSRLRLAGMERADPRRRLRVCR